MESGAPEKEAAGPPGEPAQPAGHHFPTAGGRRWGEISTGRNRRLRETTCRPRPAGAQIARRHQRQNHDEGGQCRSCVHWSANRRSVCKTSRCWPRPVATDDLELQRCLGGASHYLATSLSALGRGAIPNGECGLSRDETLPHQTSHFGFNTGKLPTDAPCSASLSGKPAGPKLKTNLPPLCFAFAMADAFIHPSGGLWQTRGIRQAVREMSRPAMCAVSKTARGHSIRWVQWLIVFPGRKSEPLAGPCRD